MAASVARTNDNATVVAWASSAQIVKFNPRDSVMTNASKFAQINVGYGTNAELAIKILNQSKFKGNFVLVVSDNQSWLHGTNSHRFGYGGGAGLDGEWRNFKARNPKAKLVCLDIQPYGDVLVPDDKNVMNIGGFTDSVFTVIGEFSHRGDIAFTDVIKSVEL